MSNEKRRKLLKSIAAGSGAVIAGKSMPEGWTKPVVDSVLLPVHAQTSILDQASVTWIDQSEGPEDEIFLNVDGQGNYSMTTSNSGGVIADTLVQFDGDWDAANWDYYVNGSNWPAFPSSWSGPSGNPNPSTGENNLAPGTYTIVSTHGGSGNTFQVTFTVDITPTTPNTGRTMTVTLNSIT